MRCKYSEKGILIKGNLKKKSKILQGMEED